jgi:ABC-type antimicrobial peptide transport system permease subunit
VRQGLRLMLFGLATVLVSALALVRFISGTLYGVTPYDPWTFLPAPALVLLAALLACCTPVWRAAHIQPVEALRSSNAACPRLPMSRHPSIPVRTPSAE